MMKKYHTDEERKAAEAERSRKYRENNKERIKEYRKEYRENNREKLKEYNRKYRENNKEKFKKYYLNSRERRKELRESETGYIGGFLKRARWCTPDTDLDREFFEGKMKTCCVTGKEFLYSNPYSCFMNPLAPSIDRIDSSVGYYKGNVQVVLACINRFKNDMPNEDFLELWKALTS